MGWIWHLCLMNMKRRKIRTFLTVLGVTIGVISVVALLAVGIGVKQYMVDSVESSGSVKQIVVYSQMEGKHKDRMITDDTIATFAELTNVTSCYPRYDLSINLTYGKYVYYGSIIGIPEEQLAAFKCIPESESLESTASPVLVLGSQVGSIMYNEETMKSYKDVEKKGIESIIGDSMTASIGYDESARTARFKVAAVIDDGDSYSDSSMNIYCDIKKLQTLLRRLSSDGILYGQPTDGNGNAYNEFIYTSAVVTVDSMDNVDYMVKKFQDMGYTTENNKEYLDTVNRYMKIVQLLLGCIGAIALVVAVIGISNTMTTSVFDRINEIGVLKVLGCDNDELRTLFLLEAGIIGAVGGTFGVILSYGLKTLINKAAVKMFSLTAGAAVAVIPWWLAIASVAGAILLAVLAGYFPARWASKVRPINAITSR